MRSDTLKMPTGIPPWGDPEGPIVKFFIFHWILLKFSPGKQNFTLLKDFEFNLIKVDPCPQVTPRGTPDLCVSPLFHVRLCLWFIYGIKIFVVKQAGMEKVDSRAKGSLNGDPGGGPGGLAPRVPF